jgi:predicted nucleotidyltransferase
MKEEEKKLLSYKDILPQLKEIKKEIAKILGTNDFELIVFGSYARGEAREDSDLDLLLLTKEKIDWKKEHELIDFLVNKYLKKYKLLISITPMNEDEKEYEVFLWNSIEKEGVKV